MKGNFDAYLLWPLDKIFQKWVVDKASKANSSRLYGKSYDELFLWNRIWDLGWFWASWPAGKYPTRL